MFEPAEFYVPMVRLWQHDLRGMEREPVTCRGFAEDRYRYCAKKLADFWVLNQLAFAEVRLPDFDNEIFPMYAMVPKGASEDIVGLFQMFAHHRSRPDPYDHGELSGYGYDIAPVGRTDTFGYRCKDTVAWLLINKEIPALLTRRGDDVSDMINTWLEFWLDQPEEPWRNKRDNPELYVAPQMMDLSTYKQIGATARILARQSKQRERRKSISKYMFGGNNA